MDGNMRARIRIPIQAILLDQSVEIGDKKWQTGG